MRFALVFAVIFAAVGGAVAGFAGCYQPGDIGSTPYKCTNDFPECPDGYTCQLTPGPNMNRCVKNDNGMMTSLEIPKTGTYSGQRTDPGLNPMTCQDSTEMPPNNDIGKATLNFDTGASLGNISICPAGDVDVYQATAVSAGDNLRATITYEIAKGDLDLGIFDAMGMRVAYDADFMKNDACVTIKATTSGNYFVVVVGAKNGNTSDQNRYIIKIQKDKAALPCGGGMPDGGVPDMSRLPDLS